MSSVEIDSSLIRVFKPGRARKDDREPAGEAPDRRGVEERKDYEQ